MCGWTLRSRNGLAGASTRQHLAEASFGCRRALLGLEYPIARPNPATLRLLTMKPPQCPHLLARHWMHRRDAIFAARDMHDLVLEVDLLPGQRDQLCRTQAVLVGD